MGTNKVTKADGRSPFQTSPVVFNKPVQVGVLLDFKINKKPKRSAGDDEDYLGWKYRNVKKNQIQ